LAFSNFFAYFGEASLTNIEPSLTAFVTFQCFDAFRFTLCQSYRRDAGLAHGKEGG
jgi:hypothetical protein